MTIAERLRGWLEEGGFGGQGGRARFRALLSARGTVLPESTFYAYLSTGEAARKPPPEHVVAMADALGVQAAERSEALSELIGVAVRVDAPGQPSGGSSSSTMAGQ